MAPDAMFLFPSPYSPPHPFQLFFQRFPGLSSSPAPLRHVGMWDDDSDMHSLFKGRGWRHAGQDSC